MALHAASLCIIALLSYATPPRPVAGLLRPRAVPQGVSLELRTVGGKRTFYLSETIPLEIWFASSKPSTYSIELADGWNEVPTFDRFVIEPAADIIDRVSGPPVVGIVCCDSRRPYLQAAPAIYTYDLTDSVRFTRPGTYRIQYTTRRVFTGASRGNKPSDITARSNVISITIVDDDPAWLDSVFRDAIAAQVRAPSTREVNDFFAPPALGSLRRQRPAPALAAATRASRMLRMLDTLDAIRVRVARLQTPTVAEWRDIEASGNGFVGGDRSVALSSRPDLMAAALSERASLPGFGVMRGYAEVWADVIMEMQHPRMFSVRQEDEARDWDAYGTWRTAIVRELLERLQRIVAEKTGTSAEITRATILALERSMQKHQGSVALVPRQLHASSSTR